jgi:hypothetical protein
MTQARHQHAAVRLPDGRVLIAGGTHTEGTNETELAGVELWDPSSRSFQEAPPLPRPVGRPRAVLLARGRVLLWPEARGRCGPPADADRTLMTSDPRSGSWQPISRLPRDFCPHAGLPLDGRRVAFVGAIGAAAEAPVRLGATIWDADAERAGPLVELAPVFSPQAHIVADASIGRWRVIAGGQSWLLDGEGRLLGADTASAPPSSVRALPANLLRDAALVALPDGRLLAMADDGADPDRIRLAMVWTPQPAATSSCGGLAAYLAAPVFSRPEWLEALASPDCQDAAVRGQAPELDQTLSAFATREGAWFSSYEQEAEARFGWQALCLLGPPWSAPTLAGLTRNEKVPGRHRCLARLAEIDTDQARELTARYLGERAVTRGADDPEVDPILIEALPRSRQLRSRMAPVLARARREAAWGVDRLWSNTCALRVTDPHLATVCAGAGPKEELARVPYRHVHRRRLAAWTGTVVASGIVVGISYAARDAPVGRGLAISAATFGGVTAGGAIGLSSARGGTDWGEGVGAGLGMLAGALVGGAAGAAAGTVATREPGLSRPVTTAVGLMPLLVLATYKAVVDWNRR